MTFIRKIRLAVTLAAYKFDRWIVRFDNVEADRVKNAAALLDTLDHRLIEIQHDLAERNARILGFDKASYTVLSLELLNQFRNDFAPLPHDIYTTEVISELNNQLRKLSNHTQRLVNVE